MSITLKFGIEFKSDFHVSAGHGLGLEVDSALLRDPDNVPVIRGTTLTGLMRERLVQLISLKPFVEGQGCLHSCAANGKDYCGQFAPNDVDCPVCAIFGSPRHGKQWRISSARPVGLEKPQKRQNSWQPGESLAQITTRVRVNPRTRRAEEHKLFNREEGDSSVNFCFTAECAQDDEIAWQQAEWLVAAARLTRNLGAGKKRGRGECEIHLLDREQEATLLNRIVVRLNKQVPDPITGKDTVTVQHMQYAAKPGQHSYRLRVLLRTDEPLLIARRAEAGNQFETMESIPGSVLRGAMAWRIAERFKQQINDHKSTEYQIFVELFFRDAIRFSPLLPVQVPTKALHRGYLNFPASKDLITCELHPGYTNQIDHGHGVWSRVWDDNIPEQCPQCQQGDDAQGSKPSKVKLESVGGFLTLNKAAMSIGSKSRQSTEMHIRIESHTGRVRPGDLFGYVSLDSGQYFVGEITCTDKNAWQILQQMAELNPEGEVSTIRLGKASRRGHGAVSMIFDAQTEMSPWQGSAVEERVEDISKVILTLISDAIMTDPWGRFVCGFDEAWLKEVLGLPKSVIFSIDQERCFSAARPVDTFNAKLGLPRFRDIALVAGSSACLSFSGIELAELHEYLKKAEDNGIGLRQNEGFGRVVFNHDIYRELKNWSAQALNLRGLLVEDYDHGPETLSVRFRQEWGEKLDEKSKLKIFNDGRFEAIARLIQVSKARSDKEAKDNLAKMGEHTELLAESLQGRDKNFYKDGGVDGMKKVNSLLDELGDLIREFTNHPRAFEELWQLGLQMLADHIAAPARQKAQEGR